MPDRTHARVPPHEATKSTAQEIEDYQDRHQVRPIALAGVRQVYSCVTGQQTRATIAVQWQKTQSNEAARPVAGAKSEDHTNANLSSSGSVPLNQLLHVI